MALELLQFKAEWCGPCGEQSEMLEDYDATPVRVIDVDEDQDVAIEHGVRSLPTLVLESDGEPVARWSGITQVDEIETTVESFKSDTDE